MSNMSIGNLNYSIGMDASQLNASATLTRQQMRDVRRVMQETKDPAKVLGEQIDRLDSILKAGAITAEQYEVALANVHARSPEGIERAAQAEREKAEAARQAAEAERELAAIRARGESIMLSTLNGEEKHQRAVNELDELLRRAAISQETYNRAVAQSYHRHVGAEKMAAAEKEQAEAARQSAAAESERNRVLARGDAITDSLMTGEERHIQNLREMRQLLNQNAISQETYNRAIERSRDQNLPGRPGAGTGVRNAAMNLASSMPGVNDAVSAFAMSGGGAAAMGLAAGLGAVVAAGAGVIHVTNQVRAMNTHIDETAKAAEKLGMNFNELNTLRLGLAESSGLDAASVDNAMQKMMLGINTAAVDQSGAVFDTLNALGLEAGELLKRGPVAAMEQIMDATQGLKNPTDQLAVAYDLFGKQGASLVLSLRAGKESLQDMQGWLEQTGNTLTTAQTEGIQIANDQWARMQMITQGLYTQLAAEVAPVIQVIAETVMAGSNEFSLMKDYIRPVIDNTVYFAGVLYDAYEMSQLLQTTLRNIVTLNWTGVAEGIESALDFGTGQRNLEAVRAAREQAEEAARVKEAQRSNEESELAAIERQREAAKAAAAERLAQEKAHADEQKRHEQERLRLAAEAEREAQRARERDMASVESLFAKYEKGYQLQKEIAKLDDLRAKGLLSQHDHARFRDQMLEKEARQDVQRAQAQTATKGSVEEYSLLKKAADDQTDKQLVEVRKQTLAIEMMKSELTLTRKHIEKIKQPRTYR